jgi:hypothetical protein
LLHCFLVLAQNAPALGEPVPVASSHIHEYDYLPRLEGTAVQVPAEQFLDESIELRQDFIATWFLHIACDARNAFPFQKAWPFYRLPGAVLAEQAANSGFKAVIRKRIAWPGAVA